MEFETQKITVRDEQGQWNTLLATVGIGSGLAYHLLFSGSQKQGYTLTHLKSGMCLYHRFTYDDEVARLWLEKVAALLNWNQDGEAVRTALYDAGGFAAYQRISIALTDARNEIARSREKEEQQAKRKGAI